MDAFFSKIILGHLTGDFLLQSKKMALGKSKPGRTGVGWCTLHCVIYTASVCIFLGTFSPTVFCVVFLSHWPLDRWSLARRWLRMIGGRDFISAYQSKDQYREIDIAFSTIVYTVADATLHLIILWLCLPSLLR